MDRRAACSNASAAVWTLQCLPLSRVEKSRPADCQISHECSVANPSRRCAALQPVWGSVDTRRLRSTTKGVCVSGVRHMAADLQPTSIDNLRAIHLLIPQTLAENGHPCHTALCTLPVTQYADTTGTASFCTSVLLCVEEYLPIQPRRSARPDQHTSVVKLSQQRNTCRLQCVSVSMGGRRRAAIPRPLAAKATDGTWPAMNRTQCPGCTQKTHLRCNEPASPCSRTRQLAHRYTVLHTIRAETVWTARRPRGEEGGKIETPSSNPPPAVRFPHRGSEDRLPRPFVATLAQPLVALMHNLGCFQG